MKSNHIHSFLLAGFIGCFVTIAATSCRFEEDDYFNESASLRVEHTNDAVQKILADAPNGWVMQYFCGSGIAHFEGFNLFANFDKYGKVTLASNHRLLRDGNAGKYTESESLYSLLLEDGPVLAFNTWNDVLTPFVDPVNPWTAPNALYKDGAGMAGDHNFAIVSYKDNEILLRGERHSGNVRLTKCSVDWKVYIAQAEVMRDYVSSVSIPNYYVITETDTMYFLTEGSVGKQIEQGLCSGRVQLSERLTNPVQFDSLSCVFTPKGLRFEKPDTVGGHVFQELTLNSDSTALVNEDGTVRVFATWDYYLAQSTDIMWVDTLSMSDELKNLCIQLDAALTANNRVEQLALQARKFRPAAVVIANEQHYEQLKQLLSDEPDIKVYAGSRALDEIVEAAPIDMVLTAMVGFAGLSPTIHAIRARKAIALANKETLVVAGELICQLAQQYHTPILPVDSEHSAIFQSIVGEDQNPIEKILLTASGGPFRLLPKEQLATVTCQDALRHPTWDMGAKITIDSATMMNKGFEVIEAKWLFGVPVDRIQVLVHPQSVVHSAVQFHDGSVKAQLGVPDMRLPIQYAFSFPERLPLSGERLDLFRHPLEFFEPDLDKFRCLALAFEAIRRGGNMPCIVNAANEIVNRGFLEGRCGFVQMADIIAETMERATFSATPSYDTYVATDAEARRIATEIMNR